MQARIERIRQRLKSVEGATLELALCVAAPFLFACIVGSVYSGKKLTALPVTIIDQDDSALSREVTSALLAAEPFVPGPYAASVEDCRHLAEEGASDICIVFPPDFERGVKSARGTVVSVLVNSSNLISANIAAVTTASVLGSYSIAVDVKKMQFRGIPAVRSRSAALPISMQSRTLFNPAMNANYANFLVIGMVGIAVQLSALLATARLSETRMPHPIRTLAVTSVLVWAGSWAAVRLTLVKLDLPMRGQEWLLATVILWFVANLVVVGFAISKLTRDAILASEICALITMPNFLLSGYTWPAFALPGAVKILAYGLPMNPLLFAMRRISLMGAGPADLGLESALLAFWSVAALALVAILVARAKGKARAALA